MESNRVNTPEILSFILTSFLFVIFFYSFCYFLGFSINNDQIFLCWSCIYQYPYFAIKYILVYLFTTIVMSSLIALTGITVFNIYIGLKRFFNYILSKPYDLNQVQREDIFQL